MQKGLPLFLCLCFFSIVCLAQPSNVDSLKQASQIQTEPAKKAQMLISAAEQSLNGNPEKAFAYASEAARIAKGLNNAKLLLQSEYFLSVFYSRTGKLDSVIYFTSRNIPKLKNEKELQPLLVNYYNLEGNYFMRSNKQKEALERFYNSLRIADAINDPLSQIKAGGNIGYALMELNQYSEAIARFKNTIGLMEQNKMVLYAAIYNNTASCYGALNKLDSAQWYVTRGIEVAKKNNDLMAQANGLNILGTVHQTKNEFQLALNVFLQAKTIREQIGDPFFIVSDMVTIADLYSRTGQPAKGIEVSKQALKIATDNKIDAKLPIIYQALANNYLAAGNHREAADTYKIISDLKDSLYADASPQAVAEMQVKYETEKKERQISEQQARLQKQRLILGGSVVLFLMVALLAYTQYRRYQWKQQARLKAEVLKQQELATKAVIEAEEAERQRIAKDLHDGVGQMMSAAKMNLSAFEHEAAFGSVSEREALGKIITLVDESCKEVRAVSHNMMPNALLKNNLASAIREFLNKLDHRSLQVHLYTEGLDERLDSNVETVLYRVIQECVNNVIKHSGADMVDISVIKEIGEITATIEDNGKGFDTSDVSKFDGIGVKNIRTRVEYLKGTVEFNSTPGKGTLVAVHVPL